jgi:hypothetical protein
MQQPVTFKHYFSRRQSLIDRRGVQGYNNVGNLRKCLVWSLITNTLLFTRIYLTTYSDEHRTLGGATSFRVYMMAWTVQIPRMTIDPTC